MKKLFPILLLFLFVNANTELHQLRLVPSFLMHYFEHQQENESLTFLKFVDMHYGAGISHSHMDKTEHDNVPFKSHNCNTVHFALGLAEAPFYQLQVPSPFKIAIAAHYQGASYVFDMGNTIWQPPKFC